jgi:hypothetical protein
MEFNSYIGLDVHKETNAVAIAEAGRVGEIRFYGEIAKTPHAVASLLKKLGGRHGRAATVSTARSSPPVMPARSSHRLTRQSAPAIT